MLLNGKLQSHLIEIDKYSNEKLNELISTLKLQNDLTEDMKNTNPLYWVDTMNAIKNQAEEVIYKELIYV